jgi:murein DD-endopeptidase MepM/ murein hydrolase activator NlpD
MKFPWPGSAEDMTRGDIRFVTHSAARRMAGASACAATVVALAGGVAIGHFSSSAAVSAPARSDQQHVVANEIGRMDASLALLDPRIERLAAQLAELSQFDQRLRALPLHVARPDAPVAPARSGDEGDADADSGDGQGGPALAPRHCVEASAARASTKIFKGELNCMAATLSDLEQATTEHVMAWDAFPGRRPIDGGRNGSPFGNRIDPFTHRLSFHPGVDLVAPTGTPILAAAGGRVILAGTKSGYGNAVEIDHGNGFVTRYGHASKIDVRVGQVVLPREPIGEVGSTGRSTGPHLHFEVLVKGQPVNPIDYLTLFATPSATQSHG